MTAYSYYYLDEDTVRALLSQLSQLPPKELVQSISVKDDTKASSSKERETNVGVGIKGTTLKYREKENQEAGSSTGTGISVTSTYDETTTPSSLASSLELLLAENFLVEDFDRRVSELINNWQNEVKKFSRVARDRYRFDGIEPLLEAAEQHTQRLIEMHINNIREKRLPDSISQLVTVKVRQFKWCSRPCGDNHFRFEGVIRTNVKFQQAEKFFNVCSIAGVGQIAYLTDGALELVKEDTVVESADVLGKFQSWNNEGNQMIVLPILIR